MKKVVALDQTSPYYFHDLGWAEYRCKNKKEAENALRKCMKLNPDSADIWDTIGKFFREIGNYEEVQSAFKRAKDLRKTMKEK